MENSLNFEEKYQNLLRKINHTKVLGRSYLSPGIQKRDKSLIIQFYNKKIIFNEDGVSNQDGEQLTDAVKTVISRYLLMYQTTKYTTPDKLVTLRELSNSSPLFSNITGNTGKTIETSFSGKIDKLRIKCFELQGTKVENNSFDLSFRFMALSGIPIILNFNDQDEMMPANATYLFYENAGQHLDIESLTVLSTYLTGQLIN